MFTEALEALTMGEEAFSLCNPKSIETWSGVTSCSEILPGSQWQDYASKMLEKDLSVLMERTPPDSDCFKLVVLRYCLVSFPPPSRQHTSSLFPSVFPPSPSFFSFVFTLSFHPPFPFPYPS
ncbi:hypothetical protein OIU77_005711 [Salix suchowensis]|uniref:Uncharacterized protein n=1 Tax=Salix suchowensis TaxID=1278906 RepID=A0ABQ9AQE4_9ROSI|nr:hypothetical protein OIU77_005711 [Salix suchowensis]